MNLSLSLYNDEKSVLVDTFEATWVNLSILERQGDTSLVL